MTTLESRISGFYRLPMTARHEEVVRRAGISPAELRALREGGLDEAGADQLVENAIGVYALPLGLGLNFRINGVDRLVPMAIEEPSVVAAASNAARMVRAGGGFVAEADEPIMTAQIELLGATDPAAARVAIEKRAGELACLADALVPRLVARGGGCRAVEVRLVNDFDGSGEARVVVHLQVDCRDVMGANLVNTIAEGVAPRLAQLAGARFGLRILTNLCDRRRVRAQARVPLAALAGDEVEGRRVAEQVASASRFAELDPYRAATHNKGIMNGVDAVVIATGNDWRGVEAGAHAFAAATGRYRPLAIWRLEGAALCGQIELPLAVGVAGGTMQVHQAARAARRLLGVQSAGELAMVMACVGLASNLAALRALATEGIQRGHMALHRRAVDAPPVQPLAPGGTVGAGEPRVHSGHARGREA
jgi:hydroxymethylglutaryl-CoA reductase